jgi:signal transduction histidine kinase/PAS domain-containing protein
MNILPPFSNSEFPFPPATAPGETDSKAPSPLQRSQNPWLGLVHWIHENTFSPRWLPEQLRRPVIGYLLAALIELVAASLILLLLSLFPSFAFHGILTVVGVVLVTLGWGAGPGLFATLVGTLLLYYVVLPPHFSWILVNPADSIGLALYLVVGASISVLAGRSERARRRAEETAQFVVLTEGRSRIDAEQLRTVLEVLPAAVLITNREGQLLTMNHATTTLWGSDIPLGTNLTQYSQHNQFKAWWARTGQPLTQDEWPLVRALSSGQAVLNEELEIETPDGQHKAVLHSAAPLHDERGIMTGAVVSSQEVSELRRLEGEAAERAQELEAIFESIADGVFVYDAQGRVTHVNAAGREVMGPEAPYLDRPRQERAARRPPRDEQGQPIPFDRIPSLRILHGEVITGAKAVDVYLPTPGEQVQALSVSGRPLCRADGAITGAVLVTRDVTERWRLEREVTKRAQELEAIVGAVTDGICLLDTNGNLVRTNQAFRKLLGFDRYPEYLILPYEQRQAALTIRTVQGQPLPLDRLPDSAPIQVKTYTGVDLVVRNLEGREVVVNVDGVPLHDQGGAVTGYVEVYRDMTARHHMEQQTRETLAALVAMAEAMVQIRPATSTINEVDKTDEVSTSAVVADTGLSLIARHMAELTQSTLGCRHVSVVAVDTHTGKLDPVTEVGLPPEQAQTWWASWSPTQYLEDRYGPTIAAQLYAGESALLDTQRLSERFWYTLFGAQTGRIVPMRLGEELVGLLLVDYQEPDHDYSSPEESLLTGTLAHLGTLVLERDQLLRGWAETRASALALEETKAQMDTFLSIASHELRTPLTSLKLSLQLSQRRLHKLTASPGGTAASNDTGLQSAVEQVNRTVHQLERLEALVNDLVDVSRIQVGKLELRLDRADLAAIVREAVLEQQEAAPERSIHFQRPADWSVLVHADSGRIEQVVTNFLTNALKYSQADRPVEVGVEVEQQVRVWVRDHGPGLPLSEQDHVWERFHRVKGVEVQSGPGVGLGLGLYISRIIVERHHGQVGVETVPGQGATFWFTLPLYHLEDET